MRDVRNPIVSCVGEPSAGRETEDPDWYVAHERAAPRRGRRWRRRRLETARVAAIRGHQVALIEREQRVGGIAAVAGPGAELAAWLESECRRRRSRDHHRHDVDSDR